MSLRKENDGKKRKEDETKMGEMAVGRSEFKRFCERVKDGDSSWAPTVLMSNVVLVRKLFVQLYKMQSSLG
jgi:hypothetical protein